MIMLLYMYVQTQTIQLNQLKYFEKSPALLNTVAMSFLSQSFVKVLISVVHPIGLATFENNLKGMLISLLALSFSPQDIYFGVPLTLSAQTNRSYLMSDRSNYYNQSILYFMSLSSSFSIVSSNYLLNCYFNVFVKFQNWVVFLPRMNGSNWNLFKDYPLRCESPKNLKNMLSKIILSLLRLSVPTYTFSNMASLNLQQPAPCLLTVKINQCKSNSALKTSILASSRSKQVAKVISCNLGLQSILTFELYCLTLNSMFKAYSKTIGMLALACEYTLSHILAIDRTRMARNTITVFLIIIIIIRIKSFGENTLNRPIINDQKQGQNRQVHVIMFLLFAYCLDSHWASSSEEFRFCFYQTCHCLNLCLKPYTQQTCKLAINPLEKGEPCFLQRTLRYSILSHLSIYPQQHNKLRVVRFTAIRQQCTTNSTKTALSMIPRNDKKTICEVYFSPFYHITSISQKIAQPISITLVSRHKIKRGLFFSPTQLSIHMQ